MKPTRPRWRKVHLGWVAAVALATLGLSACASGTAAATAQVPAGAKQTLVLWHNGNFSSTVTGLLVKAFEKEHPNITIKMVAEPTGNYFAVLQTTMISHKGPDIVNLWPAAYMTRFESNLVNLDKYISPAVLAKVSGEAYFAQNDSIATATYGVPFENQFYNGFYNKSLFRRAGITSVPQDWTQLYAACSALKKIGVTPIEYGSASGSGEFYPVYEWSYLLSGVLPLAKWNDLLDGRLPYTSPAVVAQVQRWAALYTKGCTNPNVLTERNAMGQFESGKAAMIFKGGWDAGTFAQAMKGNVGAMVPPYSPTPNHTIVMETGESYGVPTYSQHRAAAIEFLKFILSPAGQRAISASGQAPVLPGYAASNPLQNALLQLVASGQYHVYPMFDNFMQPPVLAVATKELDLAFADQVSAHAAMGALATAVSDLSSSQRNVNYRLGG